VTANGARARAAAESEHPPRTGEQHACGIAIHDRVCANTGAEARVTETAEQLLESWQPGPNMSATLNCNRHHVGMSGSIEKLREPELYRRAANR